MGLAFPKVSIITPSLNQATYLGKCVQSVLAQGYPNIEHIVIDGGSTDGSVEIIQKYSHGLAYWVSEPDSGQSAAMNKGLRQATGDILAWLNSDDYYAPGAISRAVGFFLSHPQADIIYGDCSWINQDGSYMKRQSPPAFDYSEFVIGMHNYIPSSSTFMKRAVYQELGDLDETLHFMMDHDYWLRAGLVANILYCPEVLSSFRVYPSAKTWKNSPARAAEYIAIHEKLLSTRNIPVRIRAIRSLLLSRAYLGSAESHYRAGGRKGIFVRYILRSIYLAPFDWTRARFRSLFHVFVPLGIRGGRMTF